ncbi:MAG TPA: dienelactone hydrolase family protein [Gemmatimonadales bacterium]|nr:dienelactone hydrolase family protein [Gemmatimonadales bacterium]
MREARFARRGVAQYLLVAALALVTGAAASWLLAGRGAGRGDARRPTTHGEWVFIRNRSGDSLRAYVAYPERKDPAPGVIVIHELFGLTAWEPTVADRLAGAGYVAIVPDLLSSRFGITPADPDSGRKLTARLDRQAVGVDLDAAAAYLRTLPAVRKEALGTIGFCWGGAIAFWYATVNPTLEAAVVCYGSAPDSAALARIRAPVLGVYGEDDARINADLDRVTRQMQALGKRFEHDIYPGTGHGFLKPGRRGSDGPQAARAWDRVLGFFRTHLGA